MPYGVSGPGCTRVAGCSEQLGGDRPVPAGLGLRQAQLDGNQAVNWAIDGALLALAVTGAVVSWAVTRWRVVGTDFPPGDQHGADPAPVDPGAADQGPVDRRGAAVAGPGPRHVRGRGRRPRVGALQQSPTWTRTKPSGSARGCSRWPMGCTIQHRSQHSAVVAGEEPAPVVRHRPRPGDPRAGAARGPAGHSGVRAAPGGARHLPAHSS